MPAIAIHGRAEVHELRSFRAACATVPLVAGRGRPCRSSPDVDAYSPSPTHEAALADLRRALADGEGLMLLAGEPGTGKTLLAHHFMSKLPEGSRAAFLTHGSFRRRADLLRAILYDLGLLYQEMTEQELRLAL